MVTLDELSPDQSVSLSVLWIRVTRMKYGDLDNEIKYRCAGQAQPTPNPLAKDQLRPKMGGGSPQTPLFTQGGQFCSENGGRIPPNPPLGTRGPKTPFFQTYKNIHFAPHNHQATPWHLEGGFGGDPPPILGRIWHH